MSRFPAVHHKPQGFHKACRFPVTTIYYHAACSYFRKDRLMFIYVTFIWLCLFPCEPHVHYIVSVPKENWLRAHETWPSWIKIRPQREQWKKNYELWLPSKVFKLFDAKNPQIWWFSWLWVCEFLLIFSVKKSNKHLIKYLNFFREHLEVPENPWHK